MAGGRLQAYGVHDLDLLLEAFGEVAEVAAATEVGVGEREDSDGNPRTVTAEDTYAIVIRFRGGGLAQVSLTSTAHGRSAATCSSSTATRGRSRSTPTRSSPGAAPARTCRPRARAGVLEGRVQGGRAQLPRGDPRRGAARPLAAGRAARAGAARRHPPRGRRAPLGDARKPSDGAGAVPRVPRREQRARRAWRTPGARTSRSRPKGASRGARRAAAQLADTGIDAAFEPAEPRHGAGDRRGQRARR